MVSSPRRIGQTSRMHDVLLLGPQFRRPNLGEALRQSGLHGPVVSITAGWQEREGELGALEEHLGEHARDLRLYERAEAVFAADPALHAAYRERQATLRQLQNFYRLRLDHAKAAARELAGRDDGSPPVRRALRSAITALRRLDAEHLRDIRAVHRRFDRHWSSTRRPVLASQRAELEHILGAAALVCIAGGHLAVLLNRLRLFGLGAVLRDRPVAAWSAGAMALAERIVLFHDHPPQGAGNAELFDEGLALVPGVVLLPHAAARLATTNPGRIALLARRFAPATCCTLDDGDQLHWHRARLVRAHGARRLTRTGALVPARSAP
jgi:hypothetical protein